MPNLKTFLMKPSLISFRVIVFLSFVSCLFLSSCSKDNNDPAPASVPLIASMSAYNEDGALFYSQTFQYDKQGRIIKSVLDNGSYSTIEYSGSNVILKDYRDGKLHSTVTYGLNNQGYLISQSTTAPGETETHEYDSNGYVKLARYENDSNLQTVTYTVVDGNYVTVLTMRESKTTQSATGIESDYLRSFGLLTNLRKSSTPGNKIKSAEIVHTEKEEYQFYTDKLNTIDFENRGIYFFGKQNKNPIKQETYTITSGTDVAQVLTDIHSYTYEYDGQGRITKQIFDDRNYAVYNYVD